MVRKVFAVALVAVLFPACGLPTVNEMEGEGFSAVADLEQRLDCGEVRTTFTHLLVGNERDALETATDYLGKEEAVEVVDAGAIWLLVDRDGDVFGGIGKAPATVSSCVNH